jgi:hypothetical protein
VSTGQAGAVIEVQTGEIAVKKWANRVAVATIALCAVSCSSMPQDGERWAPLFDGKTLKGWTPKIRGFALGDNYRDTFRVRDGAIVVSYANSGVMIFGQDPKTMAVGDSFPVSVEAQLLGPAPGQTRFNGNMCSPGTNVVIDGQLVTTHCINSKTPSGPNGVWTAFEVEVSPSGVVTQKINGAPTIVYSAVQLDPEGRMANSKPLVEAAGGKVMLDGGYISLQSEGNPIEFRNIEIFELG